MIEWRRLPWYGTFLVYLVVLGGGGYVAEGFLPEIPAEGFDWLRVLVAALLGAVAGLVNLAVAQHLSRRGVYGGPRKRHESPARGDAEEVTL